MSSVAEEAPLQFVSSTVEEVPLKAFSSVEEVSLKVVSEDRLPPALEYATSSKGDETLETRAMIKRFQEDRDKKRMQNFVRVAATGALMAIFGVFGCIVTFTLQFYASGVDPTAATAAFLLLFFFYTTGMVVISTCLNDHFDADAVLESPASPYAPLRYLLALGLFIISLPAAGFPPYFGVLVSLSAASMCLTSFGRYSWDRFTAKLDAYMIGWVIVFDWAFLWGGVEHLSISNYTAMSAVVPLVPLPPHAKGRAMAPAFLLISALLTLLLFFSLRGIRRRALKPTKQTLYCLYVFLGGIATCLIVLGAAMLYLASHPPPGEAKGSAELAYTDGFYPGFAILVVGCEFVVPIVVVLALTPKRVFNYMAARFDSDRGNLVLDGAFMAALLDHSPLKVGRVWHVHYDKAGLPVRPDLPPSDCRRNWYEGRISTLAADGASMKVLLLRSGDEEPREVRIEIKGASGGSSSGSSSGGDSSSSSETKALLEEASANLRCIDWTSITLDLFVNSVRDADAKPCYSYSRPLAPGEGAVDYFISHSWSDDGEAKFRRLAELAEWHRRKYHRWPTFWLDKVCINQSNIGAGLRALPVNVMACRHMLVLNGDTYCTRLWCIWELFTLFSFATLDSAVGRLKLMPLSSAHEDVWQSLLRFDVDDAHCYDPNEERKLRRIIESNGKESFNRRVRELARLSLERDAKSQSMGSIINSLKRRISGLEDTAPETNASTNYA